MLSTFIPSALTNFAPLTTIRKRLAATLATLITGAIISTAAHGETELVLGDQAKTVRSLVEASGVMKGAPYRYKWANFQGAAPLFEAARANAVDTVMAGDLPLLIALAQQSPLKLVATRDAKPNALGIVVPENSPIHSVKELKGHEVLVSSARGSISQYQLYGALKEAGLTPDDVKVRFILPTDAAAAFNSGRVDAWATFNPYFAIASENGGRVLRDGTGINPSLDFIAATDSALADPEKRAAIQDFLKRLARAGKWAADHPKEYIATASKLTGMPPATAKLAVERTAHNTRPVSHSDIAKLQKLADESVAEKILPFGVKVEGAVGPRLLGGE
ncbi:ABC transporter substrate-binding protein [Carnimonas bestiolae]|uniref:ABC transporter substrate-binding protein n=1 Tax=Carnimonas bestiolae TaxID=3402172 RepID=UPI003EDC2C3C